jgi:hypothetical protein
MIPTLQAAALILSSALIHGSEPNGIQEKNGADQESIRLNGRPGRARLKETGIFPLRPGLWWCAIYADIVARLLNDTGILVGI